MRSDEQNGGWLLAWRDQRAHTCARKKNRNKQMVGPWAKRASSIYISGNRDPSCRVVAELHTSVKKKRLLFDSRRKGTALFGMGFDQKFQELHINNDENSLAICVHSFGDLSSVSPIVFLYLLKECYIHGTCKATIKFRALQYQVHQGLCNSPQPGATSFVIHCMYVLPIFELYREGFSHLILSSLRRFLKQEVSSEDPLLARGLAARLFIDIVLGFVNHDEAIIVKILEAFDVRLTDIEKAISQSKTYKGIGFDTTKPFVEQYILQLIESQSYTTAASLMEHFSMRQFGETLLHQMMQNHQSRAAEKWAAFMGKPMLCVLVEEYTGRNMPRNAYNTIKRNRLQKEFPVLYQQGKESSLKKLAEKGCWDVAEAKTNGDRQLLEYLVYLAMEAGYSEKVDEICERYSLNGFLKTKGTINTHTCIQTYKILRCLRDQSNRVAEAIPMHSRYLQRNEVFLGDIVWVDEADGLHNATSHLEKHKVIGVDCEWKPNYVKGSKPNKVSIMQIASEKMVFILDLIKLFEDVPDVLDNCLSCILHSPGILKLGYNFQCDTKQLSGSYGELKCFKRYEMLLDIQNVFKEPHGGLSGLAEKILGAGLNKTRRNSNWEQRPLTLNQLEYAALDAAVLIQIFHHLRNNSQSSNNPEGNEWKSHIASHRDKPKNSKMKYELEAKAIDNHSPSNKI